MTTAIQQNLARFRACGTGPGHYGLKAALKRTHSKRFAQFESIGNSRQRLECVRFSAAFRRTVVAIAFVLVCASTAHAHDPGLSTLAIRLGNQSVEAVLTGARSDFERLPEMRNAAAQGIRMRLDDHVVTPGSVRCELDENNNFVVRLAYSVGSFTNFSLQSRWLGQMAFGHRQFFSVRNAEGAVLMEQLLSAQSDSVEFRLSDAAASAISGSATRPSFVGFLAMGVKHIWTGYDHLLFLFGLLVVTRNFGSAARIITCFTLAHSITLAVATLSRAELIPSRVIEPLIAASIVYVGIENLIRGDDPKGRWRLTFAFGLIHGFGFASVLREMGVGVGGGEIGVPLLSFNLGVELGQVAIAAVVLPLIWKLRTRPQFVRRWAPACSTVVAALGGFWLVQRLWLSGPSNQ